MIFGYFDPLCGQLAESAGTVHFATSLLATIKLCACGQFDFLVLDPKDGAYTLLWLASEGAGG